MGSGPANPTGLALTPEGNLAFVGIESPPPYNGYEWQDIFVQKLDSTTGNPIWALTYGATATNVAASAVAVDANGFFYVAGVNLLPIRQTTASLDFGSGTTPLTVNASTSGAMVLAKIAGK